MLHTVYHLYFWLKQRPSYVAVSNFISCYGCTAVFTTFWGILLLFIYFAFAYFFAAFIYNCCLLEIFCLPATDICRWHYNCCGHKSVVLWTSNMKFRTHMSRTATKIPVSQFSAVDYMVADRKSTLWHVYYPRKLDIWPWSWLSEGSKAFFVFKKFILWQKQIWKPHFWKKV